MRLQVEEHGAGDLTLLLLHGWTLDRRLWRKQVADLPDRLGDPVRILAVDMRGHGASTGCRTGETTLTRLAEDIRSVLHRCAPDGPVILAGHSLGGMAILEFAHLYPEEFKRRVAGVALISTTAEGHAHTSYGLPAWLGRILRQLEISGAALLARGGQWRPHRQIMPALWPAVRWLVFGDRVELEAMRLTLAMVSCASLHSIGGFRPSVARMNRVEALRALAGVPVAVLVGARDRLTPLKCAESIIAGLPHAVHKVLDGCGHMLPLERPDAVTDALAQVCRAVGRTPSRAPSPGG